MKNYFALTNKSDIISLGQYKNYSHAFEETEDTTDSIVWIFSETRLKEIQENISDILGMKT